MKTTIELSDAVLADAKNLARREGTTLRALIEDGLRHVLTQRRRRQPRFVLRRASVGGRGLQDGVRADDWERLRALAYEGRGA